MSIAVRYRLFEFIGYDYVQGRGVPNLYFRYSMVYALLRHNGVTVEEDPTAR